jgi:chromosome segregation ATPase
MDMPPIYMCVFLNHEYEQLKAKIVELKNYITHLEQTIAKKNLDHSRSCSISCQTDIAIQYRPQQPVKSSFDEETHLHRLLHGQNELLKKYENEALHKREQRQFQSSPPSALIEDYERRLIRCQKEKEQAERRAVASQKRMTKLEGRYENMRQRMSVLDDGFFEEVNDLKFALQQATSLGREYEKTIQMLSARVGITYPITDS